MLIILTLPYFLMEESPISLTMLYFSLEELPIRLTAVLYVLLEELPSLTLLYLLLEELPISSTMLLEGLPCLTMLLVELPTSLCLIMPGKLPIISLTWYLAKGRGPATLPFSASPSAPLPPQPCCAHACRAAAGDRRIQAAGRLLQGAAATS